MTNDEINALALQAGMTQLYGMTFPGCAMMPHVLERFARLCIAHGLEMGAEEAERQLEDDPYGHAKFRSANIAAALRNTAAEMRK